MSAAYWFAWAVVTVFNVALFVASLRMLRSNGLLLEECKASVDESQRILDKSELPTFEPGSTVWFRDGIVPARSMTVRSISAGNGSVLAELQDTESHRREHFIDPALARAHADYKAIEQADWEVDGGAGE